MTDDCPHCGHPWSDHPDTAQCACGCYWKKPQPPQPPPPPPTARDLAIERVRDAIFDELDRQHEPGDIGGAGYWDREYGCLDGEPDWSSIAAAAVDAVGLPQPSDTPGDDDVAETRFRR